jgi:SAM-dependent methyltransferase
MKSNKKTKTKRQKVNYLLESVVGIFTDKPRGSLLDLGCGDGDYSHRLKGLGFKTTAADLDEKRFRYAGDIDFKVCNITESLPFSDSMFDYCLLLEVVEHLPNPYFLIQEIKRILKPGGVLVLSTPNILNIKSRFRFFFEGAYDFFREPPLDQVNNPKETGFNLHIAPYRYHELEYLLKANGFQVNDVGASVCENKGFYLFKPLIWLQSFLKEKRSKRTGGVSHSRINRILLSKELLFGRHVIVVAKKEKYG